MTTAESSGGVTAPNSPPTKASLANWWERFKKRRDSDKGTLVIAHPINFTVPCLFNPCYSARSKLEYTDNCYRTTGYFRCSITQKHQLCQCCDFLDPCKRTTIHLWICSHCSGKMWCFLERERYVSSTVDRHPMLTTSKPPMLKEFFD
jgi:hypothetical protein